MKTINNTLNNNSRINTFLNEMFGEVRTITINDQLWFIAQDIAQILEYKDQYNMTRLLRDDQKGPHSMSTPGGNQEMIIINESGLYTVILKINKRNKERYEKAQQFEKWLTNEVLPSLRKTNAYIDTEYITMEQYEQVQALLQETKDQLYQTNLEKLKYQGRSIRTAIKNETLLKSIDDINDKNEFLISENLTLKADNDLQKQEIQRLLSQFTPQQLFKLDIHPFSANCIVEPTTTKRNDEIIAVNKRTKAYQCWINNLKKQYMPPKDVVFENIDLNRPLILFLHTKQYDDMDVDNAIKTIQDQITRYYKIDDKNIRCVHCESMIDIDSSKGHDWKNDGAFILFGFSNYEADIHCNILEENSIIYDQDILKQYNETFIERKDASYGFEVRYEKK